MVISSARPPPARTRPEARSTGISGARQSFLREFRASSQRAGSEVRIFCGKLELGIEIFESSDPIDGANARGVGRKNGESGGKAEKSSGEKRAARASGDEDDGRIGELEPAEGIQEATGAKGSINLEYRG